MVERVPLGDESAVRMAQQGHLGEAQMLDHRVQEMRVRGEGVVARVGESAGRARADRLDVDDGHAPLQLGHAEVLPADARPPEWVTHTGPDPATW